MEKSNLMPFIRKDLHILFIGLNPAKGSSDNRHYFSVNQALWNQLYDSGLITAEVDKSNADEIVFGSNAINYQGWNFGITDLVTEIAESDSREIVPNVSHCEKLMEQIQKFQPKLVILLHYKLKKKFLPYLGEHYGGANIGQIGRIIENCPTMFYSIAFPHGSNIPSKEKVEKYKEVKEYLLGLEVKHE